MLVSVSSCSKGNIKKDRPKVYSYPELEAQWIRDGEPIEFEGALWYPMDMTETLLDDEVFYMGEYRGVEFFIEKIDVRPYERLYTKFGRNKFRTYEHKTR